MTSLNFSDTPDTIEAFVLTEGSEFNTFPLSFGQQRLWFLQQLQPNSSAYHLAATVRLTGKLDISVLYHSLQVLVQRHESLRTIFPLVHGHPFQVIVPDMTIELPLRDLRQLPAAERVAIAQQDAFAEARLPFDLAQGPLLRTLLLLLDDQTALLVVTLHHIIADGWSIGVFMRELSTLYNAACRAELLLLPDLPIQYADYAVWQRQWLQGEAMAEQLRYWQEQLATAPTTLALPSDFPRPLQASDAGARYRFSIPVALTPQLNTLSRREGVTLFMTLLAAFQTLLYRYSGQADFLIGTPVANRNEHEVADLIGFFVNTLVLRSDLTGNPRVRTLLQRVRERTLAAYEHQDLPFERLVAALHPERDPSRNPLFQVMFALQNTPAATLQLADLALDVQMLDTATAKVDLMLDLSETANGLEGWIEYRTDLFAAATIARMAEHFQQLLEAMVANPEQRLGDLPLLTAAERKQIIEDWNATRTPYPADLSVAALFEQQAARYPEAIALVCDTLHLSYAALNRRANQLAHYLRACGIGPELAVGLCAPRSPEVLIGMLAIVKAGGVYVPLDPAAPAERLAFMLQDAGVRIVLCSDQTREQLAGAVAAAGAAPLLISLSDWAQFAQAPDHNPAQNATPDHLIYIMYTSGSSGQPKGVRVTQRNVVRLVQATDYADLSAAEVFFQFAPLAFDAATFEIWGSLLNAARLVLPPALESLEALGQLLDQYAVTTLWLTAGLFHQMVESNLSALAGLRQLLAGGDALSLVHVQQLLHALPNCRLINGYGPTEGTTFSCCQTLTLADLRAGSVPIGGPIANTQVYVLDRFLQPLPIGVPGELYIAGDGLARDYLNRPALTAAHFVPNPFAGLESPVATNGASSSSPGRSSRLYKTGDLVRWRPDGRLEFLGRSDQQVKIRGFRVEPGEIAARLHEHPAVQQALVLARADLPGDKRLVAYIVPSDTPVLPSDLRTFLQARLPDYMIPAAFVLLDAFPLTPNGKVDQRRLPSPDWGQMAVAEEYALPRTPLEELLASIWSQVLGMERIGIHDSFFDLGGHSLLATRLLARVRETLQSSVSLSDFFAAPTIAGLATCITREQAQTGDLPPLQPLPRPSELPLSFAQQRLWFIAQLSTGNSAYTIPAAWRISGPLKHVALEQSLNRLIQRHETLRTTFVTVDGRPVQRIAPELYLPLPLVDLRHLPAAERGPELERRIQAIASQSFDLSNGPLVRVLLFQLDVEEHVLFMAMHHIISDGWSVGVIMEELGQLYRSIVAAQPPLLPDLPIQYADYAIWQQQWLQGAALAQRLAWWKQQLHNLPELNLPTDWPRPATQTFDGARHYLTLSPTLTSALKQLSQREGATLFMTLLTAFNMLLHAYTGQDDIVIGTPIANRSHSAQERLIGLFVNTLVLRSDLRGNPSVRALLHRVREMTLGAYAHQDLPFEQLVDALLPRRDTSRNPLFQVVFGLQNMPMTDLELAGLNLHPLDIDSGTTQFDLTLLLSEQGGGLRGWFNYNTNLFAATTIERMAAQFSYLLELIVADPSRRLNQFSVLTSAEQQLILAEWNTTSRPYPQQECIHQRFERQVEQTPNAPALAFRDEQITYRELNERANRLAHRLQALGIGPRSLVAICVERSIDMVVSIFGVLKAGAAYIPIDPHYPLERIRFVLEDAQVALLLTQEQLRERLPITATPLACIDSADTAAFSSANPITTVTAEDLAYVIYTSGSTGRPKGAMQTHRNAAYFFDAVDADTSPTPPGVLLAVVSFAFDVSVLELLWTMTRGFLVVIQEDQFAARSNLAQGNGVAQAAGYSLLEQMRRYAVTHMFCIPSFARAILLDPEVQAAFRALRVIWLGGETLTVPLAQQLGALVGGDIFNVYGPTEITVWSMSERVPRDATSTTLGRPVPNAEVYILDRHFQPVPIGVPGEICIGGAGVGRGYLRRPDLTAERFIPNPFVACQVSVDGDELDLTGLSTRLYRSGDLGRFRADGSVEFLGRIDHQVKLRGFRIETQEIEKTLERHPAVQTAVVMVREDHPGDQRLVAYVVPSSAVALPDNASPAILPDSALSSALREMLQAQLPDYMVPTAFVLLAALPLTPSGKVDRRALPAPDKLREEATPFVAPSTDLERRIAALWQEVLHTDQISIYDNFFEVGGNSLLLLQLHSKLQETFSCEMELVDLFSHPTISALAAHLAEPQPPAPADDSQIQDRAKKQAESVRQTGTIQRQKQLLQERRRKVTLS